MAGSITRQDERVRVRAYLLWEKAGRPHGRNEEFWEEALIEILQETESPPPSPPPSSFVITAR
ncbi:DUF2934 domain-containing protein [Granulibacter bethesdensis]|uniref:DUF2934 domain-containing protein n=1 Tax=Granulibacter bethesdensis (strain ATCC BAA-1260 / CGDNIH1) TaxID=391165 RepID=Q0BUC6_GRABC|nr:Hypothetical protein GbCGDNIH1_0678 [Granulibacter bethesdensis CGDNIH1]AHJ67713.1 Hypothetical protein GbCGDNIH2_0678 [Granulibacter bethesdensis]APH51376.1 Hypothetical protein GbCGDNIH5_0678 [Granulibacter bethesdensis]APH58998.1 Hypothetical protein GbCGDNIH7_0678 [Granulibacter bethesdensis]APH64069.1 Hypothetical protein GbCGDNIH1I4_0678 [Granulibacter bethesdensis]